MNEIKVFNYESAAIRTVSIAGEPWWVAKDICDAIGLTNPTEAVKSVDADDLSRAEVIDTMGRKQSANIVNHRPQGLPHVDFSNIVHSSLLCSYYRPYTLKHDKTTKKIHACV